MLSSSSKVDQVLVEGGAWPAQRNRRDTMRAAVADLQNVMQLPPERRPVRSWLTEPEDWPTGIPKYRPFADRLPTGMSVEDIISLRKECLGGEALHQLIDHRGISMSEIIAILQRDNPESDAKWEKNVRRFLHTRLLWGRKKSHQREPSSAGGKEFSSPRILKTAGKQCKFPMHWIC